MTRNRVQDMSTNMKERQKKRRDNENVTRNLHLVYFFLVAFSADFVTKKRVNSTQEQIIGTVILTFAGSLLSLVNRFNDADGNSLSHVTDGETTKRRVLVVGLNTLVRNHSLSSCKTNKFYHIPWACLGQV
jgi:hypothetical protein